MNRITLETFNQLISDATVKPRLKKELRFVTSTEQLSDEEWHDRELLAITDRNGAKGVLLIDLDEGFYIVPYELKTGIVSSTTGRAQSIICDFCRTWQYGNKAGSISFAKSKTATISYLCCADLKCSMHVRTKTPEARTSRAQLREDLSIDQRIDRLRLRLSQYLQDLPVSPLRVINK